MAGENAQVLGGWDWLKDSGMRLVGGLVFARGVTQDKMFAAFGADPLSAGLEEDCEFDPDNRRVRAGRLGEWAFAIDKYLVSLDLACHGKDVGKRLSAGTEVVVVSWTAKPTEDFEYWADGTLVTRFEPYRVYDRFGSEPDRFLHEIQQLGMLTEPDDEEEEPGDVLIATLNMATLALGIRLTEQIMTGPLATVIV